MSAQKHRGYHFALAATLVCILTSAGCMVVVGHEGNNGNSYEVSGSSTTVGNNQIATENRDVPDFRRLSVSGPLQVEVQVGAAPGMTVTADANLIALVRTQTADGMHKIWVGGSFRSQNPIRVVYTVTQLDEATVLGSGRLSVQGIHHQDLKINSQGSGSVVLAGSLARLDIHAIGSGDIDAKALRSSNVHVRSQGSGAIDLGSVVGNSLEVHLLGSGSVRAIGEVSKLHVRLSGSGSAELAGLKSQTGDLQLTGSGDISAVVAQTMNVQSQGSGKVRVLSKPL